LFSIEYQILILPSAGSSSAEEYVEIAKPGFDSIATRDTSGECMVLVRLAVEATMRSSTATSCSEVPMLRGEAAPLTGEAPPLPLPSCCGNAATADGPQLASAASSTARAPVGAGVTAAGIRGFIGGGWRSGRGRALLVDVVRCCMLEKRLGAVVRSAQF
jgi:hypothetical protein